MIPNFDELNNWIRSSQINPMDVKLSSIISQFSSIARMANNLPDEYARLYSVIQQIKYATDGTPTDVTPTNNQSVAESVPAVYLQRIKDAALALAQMQSEFDITKSGLDFQFNTDFNFYRRNEFVLYTNSNSISVRKSGYAIPNLIRGTYYQRDWKIGGQTYSKCYVRVIAWLNSKTDNSIVGVVTEIFRPAGTKRVRELVLYTGRAETIAGDAGIKVNPDCIAINSINAGQTRNLVNRDANELVFSESNVLVGVVATQNGAYNEYTTQELGSRAFTNLTQNKLTADGLELGVNESYIPATTGVSFVNYDIQPLIDIIENL